ncbi:MAG: GNAT family N-acetyltransferase, partial [Armatimonadota bacterium]|nr:GNAT family N-acetyltransferase [Armatimonadota bacterium]
MEIKGSTPASRFLVLEQEERLPFEPRILGYLRVDPPIPRMHRRTQKGIETNIRERVFPASWFCPTFRLEEALHEAPEELAEADWRTLTEVALERVNTAAARIARVVVHPDYRADGLGALLVRRALRWIAERRIPEMRRKKHLVETVAQMSRYHPFFERVGFRYVWETASGRPVLLYPLTETAQKRLEEFLTLDPEARPYRGRLYRP